MAGRSRYLYVNVPLYGEAVHVIVAPRLYDAAVDARRRWPDLDLQATGIESAGGYCTVNDDDQPVILLPRGASPGCIAHECLHAAHFVLQRVGVGTDADNDEAAAYVLQHIVDAVSPWLKRRR